MTISKELQAVTISEELQAVTISKELFGRVQAVTI